MALWDANKKTVPAPDRLVVGDKIIIPRADQLDPALIQQAPAPAVPAPIAEPVIIETPPPPEGMPGPFGQGQGKTRDPAARVASQGRPAQPGPKPVSTTKK